MSEVVIIQIEGYAVPGIHTPHSGKYVMEFDPLYRGNSDRGRGLLLTTDDITQAKRFKNGIEAFEFWRQQSPTVPLRTDGKPNRPLTAFTVSMIQGEFPPHS